MRRSNITLLALVGSAMVLIAGIPVLYQGELSKAKSSRGTSDYSRQRFPDVKVVKLIGMQDVTIITSDTLAIDIKQSEKKGSELIEAGDTLIVKGSGSPIISVATQQLVAINSRVLLKGSLQRLDVPSISVSLTNSLLYSQSISRDKRAWQHLNELRITDNSATSVVELNGRFAIEHLILRNVERLSCAPEVGMSETDFSFDDGRVVKSMSCREGLFISH